MSEPASFLEAGFPLPSLSPTLDDLRQALGSPSSVDARAVEHSLSSDARLAQRIMKIVGSPYYDLPTGIRELRHAVAYLGAEEIERIATVAVVTHELEPDEPEQVVRFWYHGFLTALCAKTICKNFARGVDPEPLHAAALLHDMGKLAYLRFFPEHYRKLIRHCSSKAILMAEAEEELGLPSHVAMGAALADRWSLPPVIGSACGSHELSDLKRLNDDPAGSADHLRILCSANLLSNLASGELTTEIKTEIRTEVLRALECNDGGFLLLMGELYELRSVVQRFLESF